MTEAQRKFASRKFRWLEQVARDHRNLPPLAVVVCIELCHLFDLNKGGGAWPWQDALADALGVGRWPINRALAALIARGHLQSTRQGRDRPNLYHMVLADDADGPPSERSRSAQARTSSKARSAQGRTSSEPHDVRDSELRCAQNDNHDVRNSAQSLSSKTPPKTTGSKRALHPDHASLGEGRKKRAREGRNPGEAEPNREAETAAAFARFWAVYPRQVEQEDARAAFARAVKGGADVEAIIARARLYALERAAKIAGGDDPSWTRYPATWLKKKKWNDPPDVVTDGNSPPIIIDNITGERVAVVQPRRGGKLTREQIIARVVRGV